VKIVKTQRTVSIRRVLPSGLLAFAVSDPADANSLPGKTQLIIVFKSILFALDTNSNEKKVLGK